MNKAYFLLLLSLGISLHSYSTTGNRVMKKYTLPALDYADNALEPHIDAQTMTIHRTKHHQAYVDNLNKALEQSPNDARRSLIDLLQNLESVSDSIKNQVRNHGGGHYNHSLFWKIMMPNAPQKPDAELLTALEKDFGSFETFKELFDAAAKSQFGSGWAWLCWDSKSQKLVIKATANQDTPLSQGLIPLLGLDVWEHAYYLKYQNKRPEYVTAWWSVINWPQVQHYYLQARDANNIPLADILG